MRFRNSLRLLIENFKYAYKIIVYKAIVALVAIALCCAFVLPEMLRFWNSEQVRGLITAGKEFVQCFLALDSAGMETAKAQILGSEGALEQVITLVSSMTAEIILTVIGFVVVYILRRLADTVCHFAVGALLNDKMATYAETPFSASLISNLGKAMVYSLVYVPLTFVFDVLVLLVCWLVMLCVPIFVGLFVCTIIIVLSQALKLTLTVYWMPALTNGMRLRDAMRSPNKEVRAQTTKVFGFYFASVYFIIIVNAMAAVFTFGSALILTVPASYVFLICGQYVCYYTIQGKKYFITYDKIAVNPDRGDSEHFFDYISGDPNAAAETAFAAEISETQNLENEININK